MFMRYLTDAKLAEASDRLASPASTGSRPGSREEAISILERAAVRQFHEKSRGARSGPRAAGDRYGERASHGTCSRVVGGNPAATTIRGSAGARAVGRASVRSVALGGPAAGLVRAGSVEHAHLAPAGAGGAGCAVDAPAGDRAGRVRRRRPASRRWRWAPSGPRPSSCGHARVPGARCGGPPPGPPPGGALPGQGRGGARSDRAPQAPPRPGQAQPPDSARRVAAEAGAPVGPGTASGPPATTAVAPGAAIGATRAAAATPTGSVAGWAGLVLSDQQFLPLAR